MKPSHIKTPRTGAECGFEYQSHQRREVKVASRYILAALVFVAATALLAALS